MAISYKAVSTGYSLTSSTPVLIADANRDRVYLRFQVSGDARIGGDDVTPSSGMGTGPFEYTGLAATASFYACSGGSPGDIRALEIVDGA